MLAHDLREGIDFPDHAGRSIGYRYLASNDDVDTITAMLHEAYAPLAAAGLRFHASHQDSSVTQKRLAKGETIVALDDAEIVGIVTLSEAFATGGTAFYDRPDVASFGQFAVRPGYQGRGIGSRLMALIEQRAAEKGVGEPALDTSESASELIAMYRAKGYRFIEYVQWEVTNYRSMKSSFGRSFQAKERSKCRPAVATSHGGAQMGRSSSLKRPAGGN